MINYQPLLQQLTEHQAHAWVDLLPDQLNQALASNKHGDLAKWQKIIAQLPTLETSTHNIHHATVSIGDSADITPVKQQQLQTLLMQLHPWRKGPYALFGIHIDSEWRSDWKWQRLQAHITPLTQRLVLDVGCGNGYFCWRMFAAGAKMVLGIDPTLLSVLQFQAIRHFYTKAPVYVLPLGIEQIPSGLHTFDSVFSMGVLYHRRSPLDHLLELRDCLRSGGELILETLVIEGPAGATLVPEERYAKMRNVWFIPSCATLLSWMKRCAFKNIRLVDVSTTSTEEQRSTDWMHFHSLSEFLEPNNPHLTVEGLPAPMRAIFIAEAP